MRKSLQLQAEMIQEFGACVFDVTLDCEDGAPVGGEAERMAEIVRKIGKITKYETKSYVGRAKILDLDKASTEETARSSSTPPKSGEGGYPPRSG